MDKEKIMEAMAHIDPALVEEADRPAPRRAGWSRPALIAACLCLILAGTAAAAAGGAGMRVIRLFSSEKSLVKYGYNDSHSGYEIVGGAAYIPADSLSDEINQLALEHPCETSYKAFVRLEFAEDYIGRNLLDNALFDKAPTGGIYSDAENTERGGCLMMVSANKEGLTGVNVVTRYMFGSLAGGQEQVEVELRADLYTDIYAKMGEGQAEDKKHTWKKRYFPDGAEIVQEDYTTPDGLETIILQVKAQPALYAALFSLNGVRFEITASHSTDSAFALETLKMVLDACTVES